MIPAECTKCGSEIANVNGYEICTGCGITLTKEKGQDIELVE